eukprot:COSAG02_NODE_18866_length_913_cov_1.097052_1_plen_63_part_00
MSRYFRTGAHIFCMASIVGSKYAEPQHAPDTDPSDIPRKVRSPAKVYFCLVHKMVEINQSNG